MKKEMAICAVVLAFFIYADSLQAHHSSALIEVSTSMWITGTVVRYDPINPHAMISIEEYKEDGQTQRWIVEGPRLQRLNRLDTDQDFLRVGDVIEVCGFFLKDEVIAQRLSQDRDGVSAQLVHGRVLAMPDGKLWLWGPYGQLENCVSFNEWNSISRGRNPLPARGRPY